MGRIVSALLAVLAVSFATALVLSVPPAVPSATAKSAPRSSQTGGSPEAKLSAVFEEIGRQRFDTALDEVDKLLAEHPNFRLAHLIRGDLLLARTRPLSTMGNAPNAPVERMSDLRAEAIARLRGYREKPGTEKLPRYLLQMRPDQEYAVVVDTGRSRLYLYRNDRGRPRLVSDYYVSSGKRGSQKTREGDQKTPVGVYHITSSLPRAKLTDFYGSGAFPINYPNEWDRRQGRNGHGIWLHGTPSDTYSRPPRASDGCVVLTNGDLDLVAKTIQVGVTPVVISDEIQWVSTDEWTSERQQFANQIDQWRRDWESRDTGKYLSHYSKDFRSGNDTLASWRDQKERVNAGKTWIKVKLGELSFFRSPGKEDLMVVTFEQEYRSNNLHNVMKKRQYWMREGNAWRIVSEGAA